MIRRYLFLFVVIYLFVTVLSAKAGRPTPAKWSVKNPFEQKAFIENKGQYNLPGKAQSKDILFGARLDGLNYYFTTNGIWITHNVQIEQLQLPNIEKSCNAPNYRYINESHEINFITANSSAEIIGDSEVKQYYNFKIKGSTTVKAFAYKKITYKNLYPGIDMEFYFPGDKQGFEYSFIVHPGADISQVKMEYPLNEGIVLTEEGNISIESSFGAFTDHAPVANQEDNLPSTTVYHFPSREQFKNAFNHLKITTIPKQVTCSFALQNGIVQFITGDYDKTKDLIIDPWTEIPPFQGFQSGRVYDLDWDNAGDCYVYGGSEHYASYPFMLSKYDNNGNLLWSTATDDFLYGGFAVDRTTQSVYIAEGADILTGAQILKLDQGGAIIDTSAGNFNMVAMFRIAFSSQYNEIVVAGGSYPNSPAASAIYIDTNLASGTLVYVLNPPNPYHYMWGLTLDNFGNCYMATSYFWADTSLFNNLMFKLPMPTLSPTTWEVRDGYQIQTFQPLYIAPHNNGEGLNGMTVSDTTLYTYDSYTLRKWGTTHGTLISTLNINGDSTLPSYWGGLTSDNCNDIFLGSHDTIKQYNNNLALVNNIVEPDTIYDLKLGNNNILYACGAQFVSAIQLNPLVTTVLIDNPNVCAGDSVTLIPSGAVTYSWSPSTGLSSTNSDTVVVIPSITTTYSIIGIGLVGCPDTVQSVVTVKPVPTITSFFASTCYGSSTILTV